MQKEGCWSVLGEKAAVVSVSTAVPKKKYLRGLILGTLIIIHADTQISLNGGKVLVLCYVLVSQVTTPLPL